MIDKLTSYYGFSRMPFGRDLAPSMLHRHTAHNEALARIGWCVAERRIGVITGAITPGSIGLWEAATTPASGASACSSSPTPTWPAAARATEPGRINSRIRGPRTRRRPTASGR